MHAQLRSLFQAAFHHRPCVTVCGGSPEDYSKLLESLLPLLDGHHIVVFLDERITLGLSQPGVSVHRSSEPSAANLVRAALRQDPDAIVLDQRSAEDEATALLCTAKQTGHQIICHSPLLCQEAHDAALPTLEAMMPGLGETHHQYDLFLQLDAAGQPSGLWQAVGQPTGLVLLLNKEGEEWREQQPLQSPLPPTPWVPEFDPPAVPADWPVRREPLLEELRRTLGPHQRTAWGPLLEPYQDGARSHFGGLPLLQESESCPCCGSCSTAMQLVAQIDLSQAPEPLRQELSPQGILQLFYCVSHACTVPEAWAPFSNNSLARVLPDADLRPADPKDAPVSTYSPATLGSWAPLLEGPNWEERPGVWPEARELYDDALDSMADLATRERDRESTLAWYANFMQYFELSEAQLGEARSYLAPHRGDKLLGWPAWSQGVEYPVCPECAQAMRPVLQINNDGFEGGEPGDRSHFGQLFAGDGNGHVYHCHGRLTFSWACG